MMRMLDLYVCLQLHFDHSLIISMPQTSRLAHILLIYRQAILVTVYSHLLRTSGSHSFLAPACSS